MMDMQKVYNVQRQHRRGEFNGPNESLGFTCVSFSPFAFGTVGGFKLEGKKNQINQLSTTCHRFWPAGSQSKHSGLVLVSVASARCKVLIQGVFTFRAESYRCCTISGDRMHFGKFGHVVALRKQYKRFPLDWSDSARDKSIVVWQFGRIGQLIRINWMRGGFWRASMTIERGSVLLLSPKAS